MAERLLSVYLAISVCMLHSAAAEARSRVPPDTTITAPIAPGAATLAPFQHVRFCIRYPSECKLNPAESDQIELKAKTFELLKRVNQSVNLSIIPEGKTYGANLGDGWTIAPDRGDCNDYAVTKRHELIESGLPSKALRLSVVKTASGIGHLVLVVVTTRGDLILDNLSEAIRPWQSTTYRWLKIQSASDPRFWNEVKAPEGPVANRPPDRLARLADR